VGKQTFNVTEAAEQKLFVLRTYLQPGWR